jgi:hypothetical protein
VYQSTGSSWGAWLSAPAATSVATDAIFDAKGDLVAGTGADTAAKLTVGSNGQVLTADSAQTLGVKWATPASTSVAHLDDIGDVAAPTPSDEDVVYWDAGTGSWKSRQAVLQNKAVAKGDLIAAPSANNFSRLAVGSNGQILTADSTQTLGVKWAAPATAAQNLRASYFAQMPTSLPASSGMFRVPFFAGSSVTFTLSRASLHLETAGSSSSTLLLEKSTGAGSFLAVLVATLTLASSATDVTVTSSLGTINSGNLIRWRWTALGTGAQSFYAQLEGNA